MDGAGQDPGRAGRAPLGRDLDPGGGIFVFFAIGSVGMFVVSILLGTLVSALAVIALKRQAVKRSTANAEDAALVAVW